MHAGFAVVDQFPSDDILQVIPRGDHLGAVAPHTCCTGDTWYIELSETDIEKTLLAPMKDIVTCEVRERPPALPLDTILRCPLDQCSS
jgi:hypothetical protein